MKANFNLLINRLTILPLFWRKLIIVFLDIFLISSSLILTKWFLRGESLRSNLIDLESLVIAGLFLIIFNIFNKQYNEILRYFRVNNIYQTIILNASFILILNLVSFIFKSNFIIFKFWLLFFVNYTLSSILLRITLSFLLIKNSNPLGEKITKVVIYGAGAAGAQLAASLEIDPNFEIVCFVDDDTKKQGRKLVQVPIFSTKKLLKRNLNFDQLLLAIPSLKNRRRVEIIKRMQSIGINVKIIPSHQDLTSGRASINTLREINIEDLIYRDVASPVGELLDKAIKNKTICVTGAGGSIGSELCRQIIRLSPKELIIVEKNEFNLYQIDKELRSFLNPTILLHAVLADCSDKSDVFNLFSNYSIEVIFHAAAFKHVPLVETNPIAGLKNNVFSTEFLCKAAIEFSAESFLLVSSDKAVRPTNIMGASKRYAEMIVQAYSEINNREKSQQNIRFSVVRFGNVLNSSGSVVPVFKEQIKKGGPITITDPNIERYFMTIKEAAELMLQSLSLTEGADLFLLDMGQPIKIKTLAEEMVRLSGLSICDEKNPDGDIKIVYTGLREGEKLYEELLIDAKAYRSKHPLIFRANEKSFNIEEFLLDFENFKNAIYQYDEKKVFSILHKVVPEWTSKQYL